MSIDKTQLTQLFAEFVEKHFGAPEPDKVVIKAFDEDEMVAVEPFYILPDSTPDAHGDTYSKEECRMMVKAAQEAIEKGELTANFFHKIDTDKFTIEKVWVNEVECMIGDTLVPENQPIAKTKFHCPVAWKQRKTGRLGGLSIGAHAEWEIVDD